MRACLQHIPAHPPAGHSTQARLIPPRAAISPSELEPEPLAFGLWTLAFGLWPLAAALTVDFGVFTFLYPRYRDLFAFTGAP